MGTFQIYFGGKENDFVSGLNIKWKWNQQFRCLVALNKELLVRWRLAGIDVGGKIRKSEQRILSLKCLLAIYMSIESEQLDMCFSDFLGRSKLDIEI